MLGWKSNDGNMVIRKWRHGGCTTLGLYLDGGWVVVEWCSDAGTGEEVAGPGDWRSGANAEIPEQEAGKAQRTRPQAFVGGIGPDRSTNSLKPCKRLWSVICRSVSAVPLFSLGPQMLCVHSQSIGQSSSVARLADQPNANNITT